VGMGGDLDGILMTPQGIDSVSDLPKLLPLLQEAGCTETQIGKLMHGNFLRVFSEGLPRVEPAAPQRV
ncbi:MAG TPA: membrane dipeptidase, partial [Candidatus Acetothermia bacterium]|nr:membrane dipeptidase [Candidatus Acetothermia bacterium]